MEKGNLIISMVAGIATILFALVGLTIKAVQSVIGLQKELTVLRTTQQDHWERQEAKWGELTAWQHRIEQKLWP